MLNVDVRCVIIRRKVSFLCCLAFSYLYTPPGTGQSLGAGWNAHVSYAVGTQKVVSVTELCRSHGCVQVRLMLVAMWLSVYVESWWAENLCQGRYCLEDRLGSTRNFMSALTKVLTMLRAHFQAGDKLGAERTLVTHYWVLIFPELVWYSM